MEGLLFDFLFESVGKEKSGLFSEKEISDSDENTLRD